jgi:hypothetical protein
MPFPGPETAISRVFGPGPIIYMGVADPGLLRASGEAEKPSKYGHIYPLTISKS